ncbi:protein kinase [Planktothrix sp. FACHB-1365]|uniref:protein kinase domain-containing protein n=1 Tax=Planktothrix sp. FACHB-1365 TaxID=2692855 RepID=UPI001689B989|nr:protein kinase [Planktothrix sp. FACHB-1365]MBD2480983.1 protein kinase [Planktothrix sp. FACHB-1365]
MKNQQDDDSNDSGFGNTNKEDTEKIHQNFGRDKNNQENNPSYWRSGVKLKDYIIEKPIGGGGFGVTFLAHDKNYQKVVIKTLRKYERGNKEDEKNRDDFLNEAMRLAKCKHPHIVQIKKPFLIGDLPCIVMEYIEGQNLQNWLEDNRNFLSEAEAILYIRQIGDALQYIHSFQPILLHRDVNPKNIIRRIKSQNETEVVLIDFGIARDVIDTEQEFTEIATRGFAPIEQYYRYQPQGSYTDVYALAATLYFMLTKTVPSNPLTRLLKKGKNQEDDLAPPKIINPKISDKVNRAILSGMELFAEHRPQSVQEWLDLLPQPESKKTVKSSPPQQNPPQRSRRAPAPPPIPNPPVIKQEKLPSSPVTDWGLYLRTALMGAGVWLIAIAIFNKNLTFPPPGVVLIVGVILLAIALIKNRVPLEQKIYQLIISVVSSVGIYIGYWLNREESIDILPLIISTASASFLALLILFIFQWFINGDSESS